MNDVLMQIGNRKSLRVFKNKPIVPYILIFQVPPNAHKPRLIPYMHRIYSWS